MSKSREAADQINRLNSSVAGDTALYVGPEQNVNVVNSLSIDDQIIIKAGDTADEFQIQSGDIKWLSGIGEPEEHVSAAVGSIYSNTAAIPGQPCLWFKGAGTGNQGWKLVGSQLPDNNGGAEPEVGIYNLTHHSDVGDGVEVIFQVEIAPILIQNTQVYVDGIYQMKGDYDPDRPQGPFLGSYRVADTFIVFDNPPPAGSRIEIVVMQKLTITNEMYVRKTGDIVHGELYIEGKLDADHITSLHGGLQLTQLNPAFPVIVSNIDNDVTMANDSDTALVTQKSIKKYVDHEIDINTNFEFPVGHPDAGQPTNQFVQRKGDTMWGKLLIQNDLEVEQTTSFGPVAKDNTKEGIVISPKGIMAVRAEPDQTTATFERTHDISSHGEIVSFRKADLPIGSIGVSEDEAMVVDSVIPSTSGIKLGVNSVEPRSNRVSRDDTVSLGTEDVRFKDAHLSGGVQSDGKSTFSGIVDMSEALVFHPRGGTVQTVFGPKIEKTTMNTGNQWVEIDPNMRATITTRSAFSAIETHCLLNVETSNRTDAYGDGSLGHAKLEATVDGGATWTLCSTHNVVGYADNSFGYGFMDYYLPKEPIGTLITFRVLYRMSRTGGAHFIANRPYDTTGVDPKAYLLLREVEQREPVLP